MSACFQGYLLIVTVSTLIINIPAPVTGGMNINESTYYW